MADKESEDTDMSLMDAQAQCRSPRKDNHAWNETGVDQIHANGDPLNQCKGIGFGAVIEGEHAVEWFDEKLYVKMGTLQDDEADIVWRVGPGPESSNCSSDSGLF